MGGFFGTIAALNRGPLPNEKQRIAVMIGKQFIGNILLHRVRAIPEYPPHLAVQEVAEAGKHIADLRILRQYAADPLVVLFREVVNSVKEKIQHLVFRRMVIFRKADFFRKRKQQSEPQHSRKVLSGLWNSELQHLFQSGFL